MLNGFGRRRATPERVATTQHSSPRAETAQGPSEGSSLVECNNNSQIERRSSQDDSVVYAESKGKGRVKSRRRGESFSSRNNPGRSAAWQNAPTETHSTQEQRMAQKQSKRQSLSALEVNSSGRNHHAMGSTPNLHNAKHTHSTSEGLQPWHSTTDMSNRSPHMRKSVSQSSWDEHDPRIVQSTGNVNHREDPPSPPAPPVRDASSLKFMTVSQPGHEKFPSWPVTTASAHDTNSHAANNRTSSWSDSTQTSAELPPKPRMAYQPVLNTHAEENGVKRLLQENRVKARNSDFHRAVVTKLEGASQPGAEPPDLKHFYNSHPPYPHPQYDRDGRVREDKDYAVPSPPERDTPESVKESRYYTSASSIALMAKNKPYYRMDNANTKETSAAAEPQQPEPQVPVTKAPPPRIPATIKENEEAKKGELREDVIEKINELPSHQSWMLRKLSQEFYGQQSRYGMGVTSPKRLDHKPDEPKVKIEEEVKENKEDLMTWFDRRSRNQMSIRKAYGISDDGVQEKPPPHHAKSLSLDSENKQDGFFGKKKKEKKEKKKKKKQEKDGERLKRSSSEQFNSNKELSPKDEDRKRPSSETIRPASSEERVPQVQAFNTPRKRFSASSLDASHLDRSGANEIRRKKSLSLPRDTAREMKRSSLQSNPSQRNSGHTDSELSPPPLLDITASNYNSLSPQVDYSPPPHPWGPLSAASPKHPIRSYEDGTRPDLLQEGKIPKETDKPLPNSYEYSDSSEATSPVSPDRLQQQASDLEQPPTLPPRNYRRKSTSAPPKKSPQPLPQPQHTRSSSDGLPSSENPPLTPPAAAAAAPRLASANQGDSTPQADAYADQLRQQALRFGSQSSRLLLSSRFKQPRPAVNSRPAEPDESSPQSPPQPKPASPESTLPNSVPSDVQLAPQPIHRSLVVAKDLNYVGLSGETPHPVSSSVTMDTPFISTATSVPVASPQMAVAFDQQAEISLSPEQAPPLPPKMDSHPLLNHAAKPTTPDSNNRFADPFLLRSRTPRLSSNGSSSRPQSSSDESTPRSSRSLSTSVLMEVSQRPLHEVSVDPPQSETIVQAPTKVTLTRRSVRSASVSHTPPSPSLLSASSSNADAKKLRVVQEADPVAVETKSHSNPSQTPPSSSPSDIQNSRHPHIGRSRVAELRENILRKSNENLCDISNHNSQPQVNGKSPSPPPPPPVHKSPSPEPIPREPTPPPPATSPTQVEMEVKEEEKQNISHVSQKSFEEIAYEEQAAIVAKQLCDEEKHLSEVILPPAEHKKTSDFITGIFDTKVQNAGRRPSLLMRYSGDGLNNRDQWSHPIIDNPAAPLHCQKEELISRLEKKIEILSDEKKSLNEDLGENKKLGKQVTLVVEQKCQSKQELNKYKLYVDELDQVTYLLLKLSGRLAKAENALNMLPDHASESERAVLTAKRDELHAKHEDAKDIKEGIDRRSQQVAAFLTKYLTAEEFTDYEDFIKMKLQLTIEFQEIDDRVKQSEEQLKALKHNMRAT